MNAAFPGLGCKQRTKAIPPILYRIVADADATFPQKVLDLPQRQLEANIHHHSEPYDHGRTVETTEGIPHS